MDSRKENVNKKVWFTEDVKKPMEADMMYTIDENTCFLFTKNTWIEDSGASCHITNNSTSLFDIIDINESLQGSSRNMLAMKKGKLCINVWQVDGTDWVYTLWSVKLCPKVGANLFFLTCELLQRKNISSDHHGQVYKWQYHPWLLNQESWWLGSQSWVSTWNLQWERAVSYCPLKEKQ